MFIALKGSQFYFLFAITAARVVPRGGPIKSPSTSSIVQVIFSFLSFEISEDILRNQKLIIGQDSFYVPFGEAVLTCTHNLCFEQK